MNIQTNKWQIGRRRALKGIGATMALPFLEAMRPMTASAQGVSGVDPVRMACLFMPNGVRPDKWTPSGDGSNFTLSPILSPLEAVKDKVTVISGLTNRPAHHGDGHYFKSASWLTCTTIEQTDGANISANGVSMDQIAAEAIGSQTRLPSMELGIERTKSGVDSNVNLTRLYGSHISWKKPDVPLPCELNPRAAFDRLFKDRPKNATGGASRDASVLDAVLQDAKNMQRTLGAEDAHKLEQYMESVREVERRIQNEEKAMGSGQNISPAAHEQIRELDKRINRHVGRSSKADDIGSVERIDPTEHVRLMMDIMVLAFWTDSTRVSTFMFGNSVSNKNFSFLDGVSGAHHSISHHKNDEDQLDQYEAINTWHVAQYAYMLERMNGIEEGDSTLLDKSMILFGSGIRDGNRHSPHDIPTVLAGSANGQLKTGRHLDAGNGEPLAGVYHGMLSRLGAPVKKIGDARREIRNL